MASTVSNNISVADLAGVVVDNPDGVAGVLGGIGLGGEVVVGSCGLEGHSAIGDLGGRGGMADGWPVVTAPDA
jgi:hypothetical protein